MQTNVASRAAAVIVGLEAVGLIVIVVRELVSLLSGDAASAPSGLALLVLTAVGAAAVAAFALALWRGRSWGRSGSIVVQLLILAVALGAATGAYAEPIVGLATRRARGGGARPADPRRCGARHPIRNPRTLPRTDGGGSAQPTCRSVRTRPTWPVARTLYRACSIRPLASITKVERMTPWITLP